MANLPKRAIPIIATFLVLLWAQLAICHCYASPKGDQGPLHAEEKGTASQHREHAPHPPSADAPEMLPLKKPVSSPVVILLPLLEMLELYPMSYQGLRQVVTKDQPHTKAHLHTRETALINVSHTVLLL